MILLVVEIGSGGAGVVVLGAVEDVVEALDFATISECSAWA